MNLIRIKGFFPQKILVIMKMIVILLILGLVPAFADSYAQETKLTVNEQSIELDKLLSKIEAQTEFFFFYSNDEVDKGMKVSVNVRNKTITDILDQALKGSDIAYQVKDKVIILAKKELLNTLQQTAKHITGRVVDQFDEPVIGANVVEKGTSNGIITDVEGNFALTVRDNATLQISYIGYITQEVSISATTGSLLIRLMEDTQALEEIVVVGFGTQKKVNLTGSVSVADAKVFKDRPVATAAQALQGMVPGLLITQNEGGPSYNSSIQIRGKGTIGQGSQDGALILIDGMEGDINTINPQDIESISVLKDAAASSIYGSRAPFGVMLITTKRGKSGKPTLNYNNSFRWNTPIRMPEPVDSYTLALYLNDMQSNAGGAPLISDETMQRIQDYQAGRISTVNIPSPQNSSIWAGKTYSNANENWFKNTFNEMVMSQEHNLSISGGEEKYKYYSSLQYMDYQGLLTFNTDQKQRYSGSAKLDIQVTDWLQSNTSFRFVREDYKRPYYMPNMQYLAMSGWANIPMYDDNGYLTNNGPYILQIRDGGNIYNQNDALSLQQQFVIEPIKNWKTYGEFNYRINYNNSKSVYNRVFDHNVSGEEIPLINDNGVSEGFSKTNFLNTNVYSEYTRQIGDHTLKGMVGMQSELWQNRYFSAGRVGIMVPGMQDINITNGYDPTGNYINPSVAGYRDHWATAGYFGRVNWDYKQKYMLEGNLRYDGSSRFRADNRWIWLPSVSGGWNIAFEDFWEPLRPYVNSFKLRASYGDLANQNTSNYYPTYLTIGTGMANGNWLINGAKQNTAEAPGLISSTLTWERIRSINYGFDFGALNNRLTGSFELFTRYTLDMVGPGMSLPQTLGVGVPYTNNTDMKTYGFDLNISWNDRLSNGLGYGIDVRLSDAQAVVTHYTNNPNGYLDNGYGRYYQDGWVIGDIYGYKTKGIAKTDAEMEAHLATLPNGGQNLLGTGWQGGDLMFVDVNGDGTIGPGLNTTKDHGDLVKVGNNTPRYLYSFNLLADYKGFDVRAFFQGVGKRQVRVEGLNMFTVMYNSQNYIAVFKSHLDYFRDDPNHPLGLNTDSYFGRPYNDRFNNIAEAQSGDKIIDRFIQNAAYLRLKNLQIGYTLPASLTKKFAVQNFRIYVSGENLLTFTKMFEEFDPEGVDYRVPNSDGTINYTSNSQGSGYPMLKTYSVGCSINF